MKSERGRFWLAEENEEKEATMDGSLTVNDDGGTTITLDKAELGWNWKKNGQNFPCCMTDKFDVAGFLPARKAYVRLLGASLRTPPGLSKDEGTTLCSYLTLLSTVLISGQKTSPRIKRLMVPLGPLLPWLDRPIPKTARSDKYFEIRFPCDLNEVFQIKHGCVSIRTETKTLDDMATRTIKVHQQGWLDFRFSPCLSLEQAKNVYLYIEDLLVLLTDEECGLDWPEIELAESEGTGKIYVYGRRGAKEGVSAFNMWVLYSSIKENFGVIVDSWLEMRNQYGWAFDSYLAVRRGKSVYLEHRFATLMWGLESFHRKVSSNVTNLNDKKSEQIVKICEATKSLLNSKERSKLKKCLEKLEELPLSNKLFQLLSELNLEIAIKEMKAFTSKCAERRNDISHYGGPRTEGNHEEFITEIFGLTGALEILYHALILKEIGISEQIISDIFCKSFKSTEMIERLKLAKLNLLFPAPPKVPLSPISSFTSRPSPTSRIRMF